MDNPYSVNELTPELVEEERKRPKFSRALLTAYAVHHVCSVLGIVTGVIIKPSEWQKFFPLDDPQTMLASRFLIPMADLYIVLEPPVSILLPQLGTVTFWHWLRIPVALSIPVAAFMYAYSRRRDWLWVVAIVSFGVFVSFVLWYSMDPRSVTP
jgi:hypothetical protein